MEREKHKMHLYVYTVKEFNELIIAKYLFRPETFHISSDIA